LSARDEGIVTHAEVDTWIWDILTEANGSEWTSLAAVEVKSKKLRIVMLGVSKYAKGILEHLRGKVVNLHKVVLLAAGVISKEEKLGIKSGSMNTDHKNGNPAINTLENLRVCRAEVNSLLKSNTKSGISPNRKQFQFILPLFNYVQRNEFKISEAMRDCGYGHKKDVRFRSKHGCNSSKSTEFVCWQEPL